MKRRGFAALLVVGAVVVASPLALVAENYQKRCKRSGELIAKGDLEGAQNELDAALKKPPRDEKDRFMLGAALCELSENLQKAGDRGQAVADLREAVRLDQDEAYWHGALAKALYLEGNSEEGRKECSEAAQLSPDDSDLVGGCSLGARRVAPYKRTTPEGGNTTSPQPHTIQPVPLYKPDPPYSDKARILHYQGTVVLWLGVNAYGDVDQATVVKPLGMGLDQNALRTVRTWRFQPATRDGIPVPVRLMVEVKFKLF